MYAIRRYRKNAAALHWRFVLHFLNDGPLRSAKDIGSDDVLDKKTTDKEGNFIVDGKTSEMTNIDPILKIYHDCVDYLPCQRRWKIKIPKQYINHEGSKNLKIMDLGTWNLEAHLKEDINCF
ncbi:conserved hypothetical protein [Trichinella spiralis]|uniref:hypothetical protein n=1 Tax=Trichinella spiralis TaxID=6334 RepID=UPI0001EFCAFF|nr:conserved hypothetical protein [Trichinella spiralis]